MDLDSLQKTSWSWWGKPTKIHFQAHTLIKMTWAKVSRPKGIVRPMANRVLFSSTLSNNSAIFPFYIDVRLVHFSADSIVFCERETSSIRLVTFPAGLGWSCWASFLCWFPSRVEGVVLLGFLPVLVCFRYLGYPEGGQPMLTKKVWTGIVIGYGPLFHLLSSRSHRARHLGHACTPHV